MPTTINIDTNSRLYQTNQLTPNELRYKQYFEGIQKIYELNKDKNINIYLSDNNDFFDEDSELKTYINSTKIKIIKDIPNVYGKTNKGSGLIENWVYNKDILNKYDWIIHFEPRQLLKSNQFIDTFLDNPRNLFTLGNGNNHFNTGLFTIQKSILLDFIYNYTPKFLENNNLGIEYALFLYIKNLNIRFYTLDKMDLQRFDPFSKTINNM
jgi:hypothetical protein